MAALFAAVALLAASDLASDVGDGAGLTHSLGEGAIVALGLVGLGIMLRRMLRLSARAEALEARGEALAAQLAETRRRAEALSDALATRSAEVRQWRDEARGLLLGLGEAIDRQFERWGLTAAEGEVALLLLKGLSHKEIAAARGTTDATTRQQARTLYKKAGLTGRNDLAAFFLEDLLLPAKSEGDAPADGAAGAPPRA